MGCKVRVEDRGLRVGGLGSWVEGGADGMRV